MTVDELRQSAMGPPPGSPGALLALWHDARGDWASAHEAAQGDGTAAGAWVHAYLHRKEGDASNAGYWYRRAGRSAARGALDAEWAEITAALLGPGGS